MKAQRYAGRSDLEMNMDEFGLGGNNAKSQKRRGSFEGLAEVVGMLRSLHFVLLESASGLKVTSDCLLRCTLLCLCGARADGNRQTHSGPGKGWPGPQGEERVAEGEDSIHGKPEAPTRQQYQAQILAE